MTTGFRHSPLWLPRVVAGLDMAVHGSIRIYEDHVENFADFLAGHHFPVPLGLAWFISLFEVGGGASLAMGLAVRPISTIFALHIAAGIALVHAQNGWFVVGPGTGGMEFSVLLAATFVALACTRHNS